LFSHAEIFVDYLCRDVFTGFEMIRASETEMGEYRVLSLYRTAWFVVRVHILFSKDKQKQ